jgi:hypothetical protein
MAHVMTFEGSYAFAGPGPLHQALDDYEQSATETVITRSNLQIEGVTVLISWKAQAPMSLWFATQAALARLAEKAVAGKVVCTLLTDPVETEILPALALASSRPEALVFSSASASPAAQIPKLQLDLCKIEPWRRFKVSPSYQRTGAVLDVLKPRFYYCGKCDHRTKLDPKKMLPPWPMERSNPSVFEQAMQAAFDTAFPESLYRYDFFCSHCRTPVRVLFAIEEMRDSSFRPYVQALVEIR